MNQNNNLSILPFYTSVDELSHNRPYAYGEVYPLYCPIGAVPPFQIVRLHNEATISQVNLHNVKDGSVTNINTKIAANGMKRKMYADYGYDIVLNPYIVSSDITTAEGQYFLTVKMSDGQEYISDIFTVVGDMSGFLQMIWWDSSDLIMDDRRIVYTDNYRNVLWLNTQIGKPDYDFDEEGEERDGYFFAEKMISSKRYKFTFLANEQICDVMRFIRMSDFIRIRDRYGNVYRCDTFLCTPKWQEQGNLASMEVEFTCDTVAKKLANGFIRNAYEGDYSDAFNDDFYR